MELIRRAIEMQSWAAAARRNGLTIGFVPTMGYLHEGHLSLMRYARESCDRVVASIFVNPMQFGPQEDLAQYPRDLDRDLNMIRSIPVDAVFHPDASEMYPAGFQTRVEVTEVTKALCGHYRPQFFTGVATVVLKLFNCVQPDVAVFGAKDFQQWVTIRRMVRDLNLPVRVEGRPIVRESDGLALSSRNTYLSPRERQSALALSRSLKLAQDLIDGGEKEAGAILAEVRRHIEAEPGNQVQYAELMDPETITPVNRVEGPALLALAVWVGKTRLIDNAVLAAS